MSRTALAGIGTYIPETDRDRATWARIGAFVSATPGAFSRDPHLGGHVTASVFLLSPDRDAVLLSLHAKLKLWIHLGGHCDGIADTAFVARKEAYEESGLARLSLVSDQVFDVDIHDIPAHGTDPAHLHYDIRYLARAEAGTIAMSAESLDLRWVGLSELDGFTDDASLLRMRDKTRTWPAL